MYIFISMKLLDGDKDDSTELVTYQVKQGDIVYVKLSPKMEGLTVHPRRCEVSSRDGTEFESLIKNG